MTKSESDTVLSNFSMTNVQISLSNSLRYRTTFSVQSVPINMQCGYNSRSKSRWIILSDRYGNTILPQTFVKVGKECELNFNSELSDLSYSFTLVPKNALKSISDEYDYIGWGDDLVGVFFGYGYSETLKMDKNLRVALVGN